MGHRCWGTREAALFTVRPIEGAVRVDTERMAEEIAVAAELFLTTRQAKGDRICRKYIRGAGGPGAGQGKRLLCG